MNNALRTFYRFAAGAIALVASVTTQAAPVYTWTGVYKDTGMAQFPAQAVVPASLVGKDILYLGSENFSSTGSAKLTSLITPNFTVGANFTTTEINPSIDDILRLSLKYQYTGSAKFLMAIGTDSAHVYLFDGSTFMNITPTAAAFSTNLGVYGLAEYGQKLFIGTGGSAGSAQVWAYDGVSWTQQSLPGFPSDNYYAWCMTVYNNALYLGTVDYQQAAQVWKYDGSSWSQMTIPGFASGNYAIASMAVYNGALYIGTSNTLGGGAQIWRFDGSAWTQITGFARNDAATSMAVYNGALYIGTTNYSQNAVGQLWYYDGTTLSQVTGPASFGTAGNTGIVSLAVADGALVAGTYNNSGAELWSLTASGGQGPGANNPGALSGLFWNPNESGWGIDFTQRGADIFAAWYTYDASGNPKWYVASNCAGVPANASSGTCTGVVYEVNGPRFFGVAFTPINASEVSVAGTMQVAFSDSNNASMQFTVAGVSRTVAITRQIFPINPTTPPPVDYTDLWWNPNESGWGMAIEHQYNNILLLWYVYDGNGKPMWYVASNCTVVGSACSGTLYRTTGPAFSTGFDPHSVQVFTVGTATVTFTDANSAVLNYTVDGVSGTKNMTRELF